MGKLIVIEGIDGAGKSTQIKKIKNYFTEKGLKYEFFHFPMYGHNQFSDLISAFLRGELGKIDEVDPYLIANLYAMDRFKFLPELNKALEENDVVLLDRYVYSNIAYQCAKVQSEDERNQLEHWIKTFEFSFLNLPFPDLNLFLDVPLEITKERLENKRSGEDREYLKGKQDIHEKDLEFQQRVRDTYLKVMQGFSFEIIPCTTISGDFGDTHYYVLSPDDLFNSYKEFLDKTFVIYNNGRS